jgi:hypothetical protein
MALQVLAVDSAPHMVVVFHDVCCCINLCCMLAYASCRAGVQLSKVEVKFNNLEVSADVNIGNRGMPTVANAFINTPLVSLTSLKLHTCCSGLLDQGNSAWHGLVVCGLLCPSSPCLQSLLTNPLVRYHMSMVPTL